MNLRKYFVSLLFLIGLFTGYGAANSQAQNNGDDAKSEMNSQRIITVGSTATEMLYLVKGGNKLVATDTTSYFPVDVTKVPKIGYQRNLTLEGVLSFKPTDLIITDEAGPLEVIEKLEKLDINVVRLKLAKNADDILENFDKFRNYASSDEAFNEAKQKIEKNITKLNETKSVNKKILVLMYNSQGLPLAFGKNSLAEGIVSLTGTSNSMETIEGFKPLGKEAFLANKPDFIIIASKESRTQADKIKITSHLSELYGDYFARLVCKQQLLIDDPAKLLGMGPRTIEAAQEIKDLLQIIYIAKSEQYGECAS